MARRCSAWGFVARPAGLALLCFGTGSSCGVDVRDVTVREPDAGGVVERPLFPPPAACAVGDAYCATPTQRVACRADGTWDEASDCRGVCTEGRCEGTCTPDSTVCVGATQFQRCLPNGSWSPASTCEKACLGTACAGVCVPGARRCVSASDVQLCSSAGEWGPTLACATGCSGSSCVNECVAGSSACVSETQMHSCDPSGQWSEPSTCPLACVGSACGGDCLPGTRRCTSEGGPPQLCTAAGLWQTEAACTDGEACVDGVCACSGERAVCGDSCVSLASDPAHCGACDRGCPGTTCRAGKCQPFVLATVQPAPGAVALSDTHVYFRDGTGAAAVLRRVPKTGGSVETVVPALGGLSGPTIGGNQLYFGANGVSGGAAQRQVLRADLDGSGIAAFSPERDLSIQRLIVPGLFVYYTVRDTALTSVFRAPLLSSGQTGAGNEALFATATGLLTSMAVVNGCLFIVDENTPRQVLRTCSASTPPALRYQGTGRVSFRSDQMNDASFLYLLDEGRGTLRLALDSETEPELVVAQNPGLPSVDADTLYYFAQRQPAGAAPCSSEYTLFRAGLQPGSPSPTEVLPPPHACPTQVMVDEGALYWTEDTGDVLRLPK